MTSRPGVILLLVAAAGLDGMGARAAPSRDRYRLRVAEGSLWLLAPDGERLLDLRPELEVALEEVHARPLPRRAPPRLVRVAFAPPALERTRGGFAIRLEGEREGARYRLALRGRAGDGALELELEVDYRLARAVRIERLRFALGPRGAEQAAVLDRAYRLEPHPLPVLSDALGPRVARLGPLALLAGDGVQTLWLRRAGSGTVLELELDHEANHPFRPHLRCVTGAAERVARGELSATHRAAGSRAHARARILLGEPRLLVPGRFPRGYRAALVFTDHADQSSRAKLEALAFGETGAARAARRGLCGRGLGFTKTVFVERARGYDPQLDDPAYRALLAECARAGVEIGLHSTTGERDPPARTRALLARFRAAGFDGRTWIDHQPTTNCEAVSAQGWDAASPFHTLPLLVAAGFSLLWSAEDMRTPPGSLNLLAPEPRGQRRPTLYRFASTAGASASPDLQLFSTMRLFLPHRQLARLLSARTLEALERERGLCLAHTYLDTHRGRGKLAPRSLLEPLPGARFRLRPEVDALFATLAERQAAGSLFCASLERVASHLAAALAVELLPTAGGGYRLRAPSGRALPGLTLIAPAGLPAGATLLLDGRQLAGANDPSFDLPARREPELTLRDASGRPLRFFREAEIVLEPVFGRRGP